MQLKQAGGKAKAGLCQLGVLASRMAQGVPRLHDGGSEEVVEHRGVKESVACETCDDVAGPSDVCGSAVGRPRKLLGAAEALEDLGAHRGVHVVEEERGALSHQVEAGEGPLVRQQGAKLAWPAHLPQQVDAMTEKGAGHVLATTAQGQGKGPAREGEVPVEALPDVIDEPWRAKDAGSLEKVDGVCGRDLACVGFEGGDRGNRGVAALALRADGRAGVLDKRCRVALVCVPLAVHGLHLRVVGAICRSGYRLSEALGPWWGGGYHSDVGAGRGGRERLRPFGNSSCELPVAHGAPTHARVWSAERRSRRNRLLLCKGETA